MLRLDSQTKPFALALALFVIAWALLAPLSAPNPPLDSVEQLAWGAGWQLGYYKHPPLVAWLYGATRYLGAGSWAFMWLSAASVAAAHVFVWRAARQVVDEKTALWASALLQAIWLHSYFIPEFNQNVALIPFFAAAGFFAIRILKFAKLGDWAALGAVTGLGLLAKYSMAVEAVVLALFFLIEPNARARLKGPGVFIAIALAVLIFSPHALWMIADKGGTLTYAANRGGGASANALTHLRNFAECVGEGLLVLLGPTLMIWIGRTRDSAPPAETTEAPLRWMVLTLAFAPTLLAALLALVAGLRIKTAWIAPFFEFAPLALLMLTRTSVDAARWRWAARGTAFLALLGFGAYCGANVLGPYVNQKPFRVHFPGPALAREVDVQWAQAEAGRPLRVIIGDAFVAGSAAYFSQSQPLVRIDDDPAKAPWAGDALKLSAGAVIVWDVARDGLAMPAPWAKANPTARTVEIVSLPYQTAARIPPARFGIAIVPPAP